jgi:hypothetical protein
MLTVNMHSDVWSNCLHSKDSHASSQDHVCRQNLFRFADITWPARFPDVAVPGCFLWGCVRNKVHGTNPANIDDLKERIRDCLQGIPKDKLHRLTMSFPWQLRSVLNDMMIIYKVSYSNSDD